MKIFFLLLALLMGTVPSLADSSSAVEVSEEDLTILFMSFENDPIESAVMKCELYYSYKVWDKSNPYFLSPKSLAEAAYRLEQIDAIKKAFHIRYNMTKFLDEKGKALFYMARQCQSKSPECPQTEGFTISPGPLYYGIYPEKIGDIFTMYNIYMKNTCDSFIEPFEKSLDVDWHIEKN